MHEFAKYIEKCFYRFTWHEVNCVKRTLFKKKNTCNFLKYKEKHPKQLFDDRKNLKKKFGKY